MGVYLKLKRTQCTHAKLRFIACCVEFSSRPSMLLRLSQRVVLNGILGGQESESVFLQNVFS